MAYFNQYCFYYSGVSPYPRPSPYAPPPLLNSLGFSGLGETNIFVIYDKHIRIYYVFHIGEMFSLKTKVMNKGLEIYQLYAWLSATSKISQTDHIELTTLVQRI